MAVMMVMVVMTPAMMMMMPVTTALFTPLRFFLARFSRRAFHQPLQRQPLLLTETLQNLLYVRHVLTIPPAIVNAAYRNTVVSIGRQAVTDVHPSRNVSGRAQTAPPDRPLELANPSLQLPSPSPSATVIEHPYLLGRAGFTGHGFSKWSLQYRDPAR